MTLETIWLLAGLAGLIGLYAVWRYFRLDKEHEDWVENKLGPALKALQKTDSASEEGESGKQE
ncbi:hypothetical protein [Ferrimonas marina]|uniref:Uncharacterized protein n=1 Tax=Ferrimonas marina TaxID=299255 RepID=A0A1M5TQP0_9GAMM|nr:hypothetical protein [Ferrimonas marina]SHH53145.1 hypothetical protein SAMN02745129_2243 [Ferrimonas marina]